MSSHTCHDNPPLVHQPQTVAVEFVLVQTSYPMIGMASSTNSPILAESAMKANRGQAVRRGEVKISDPVSSTFKHNNLSPHQQKALRDHDIPNRIDGTWPRKSMPALHTRSGSNPRDESDVENRLSLGPSTILNSLSSVPSKTSLSQGKPSGFRATIRRMFGSKRRRPSLTAVHSQYHPSDPGNLVTAADLDDHLRKSSQLERPITRSHALTSHAVSVSTPPQNYGIGIMDHEYPASPFRRRNTLPSLAFSELEAQNFSRSLNEYTDKPPAAHTPSEERGTTYDERRRSRSADALSKQYALQEAKNADRQDRSSAITYWRNSVVLNPLPKLTDSLENTTGPSHKSSQGELSLNRPQIQPVQSFDFGLNIEKEPVDLEERVNTLEVKMYDFEYAIAKLQGIELSKPALPQKIAKQKSANELLPPSNNRSRSASRTASRSASRSLSRSTTSSHQGTTFLTSSTPSPMPTVEKEDSSQPDRASKAFTIRPSTSRYPPARSDAPSPVSAKLSHDQYDILMAIIQDEKAARQQMEIQLMELQKEVELLSAPVYATIRPINHPNSDSHTSSPAIHRSKKLHRAPPFEFIKASAPDVSRFSMTESDAESEGFEESFETPQENRFVFETKRGSPLVPV